MKTFEILSRKKGTKSWGRMEHKGLVGTERTHSSKATALWSAGNDKRCHFEAVSGRWTLKSPVNTWPAGDRECFTSYVCAPKETWEFSPKAKVLRSHQPSPCTAVSRGGMSVGGSTSWGLYPGGGFDFGPYLVDGQQLAPMGGSKGLFAGKTTRALILLRAFFKRQRRKKTRKISTACPSSALQCNLLAVRIVES